MDKYIPLKDIVWRYNTRLMLDDDTIKKYMREIKEEGLLHPISVFKKDEKNLYVIATGRHRFEALKLLNATDDSYSKLEVNKDIKLINEEPTYERALQLSHMENDQLKPTPLDLGFEYTTLIEQFGYTKEMISSERKEAISSIEKDIKMYQRILELNPKIISDLRNRRINKHQLLSIINSRLTLDKQQELYEQALAGKTGEQLSMMSRLIKLPEAKGKSIKEITDAASKERLVAFTMHVFTAKEKKFMDDHSDFPTFASAVRSYLHTGKPIVPKDMFVEER